MVDQAEQAIQSALNARHVFCKFLSANDSGETGGHQAGILVSVKAMPMMFSMEEVESSHILERTVKVQWPQIGKELENRFKWYESKKELRITTFGRGFELKKPEHTGALFILCENTHTDFTAYTLNEEGDINDFLNYFGLTPAETNRLIDMDTARPEAREQTAMDAFINSLQVEFPLSEEMSSAARLIYYQVGLQKKNLISENPDKILLDWTEEEYRLFRALERSRYGERVSRGFASVDDFVTLALKVLNRRKSRAGKSLEHHLAAIFDGNHLKYTSQAVTEGNKKPDFVFPSQEDYHNFDFPAEKLITLAAKTTCKDRWRQILNEADRVRDGYKYLCTLQQGITAQQMDEMHAEKVVLIVPSAYIKTYPRERQDRIWTLRKFVDHVRKIEEL